MPSLDRDKRGKVYRFMNCQLVRNHEIIVDDLWVRDGVILNPEKLFFEEQCMADVYIDCQGMLIAPGFIDVQINGGFGIDFTVDSDNLPAGLKRVAQGLLEHGVTSFCPTIVTTTPDLYEKILKCVKKVNGSSKGAGILGVHLEGPFINKEKKGAHAEPFIASLSNGMTDILQTYKQLDDVAIVTLAPELPGAIDVIRRLTDMGITVSLGHSMANLSEGEAAVNAGARFITHLFNAMLPFHHRDPHLVGLLASHNLPPETTVYYGIISDGVHTHSAALRIAHRAHPKGVVLVTDAISPLGLPSGVHSLGSQTIEIRDNRAVILGTETLCGSIATMNDCIKHFLASAECTVVDALEAASLHPAELLRITDRKGTLDYGTDADFVLLDRDLTVVATFIDGELVWKNENLSLPERTSHNCKFVETT